ncbi:MAG: DegV family protein [Thermomicrobiales bacterium]|nr:DegV family protein [Thermomicrobiales bacterium]
MANARPVAIVTDSTADLPDDIVARRGISVVPLSVRFGEESFLDGIDITPAVFLQRLTASSELPKTSQPSVAAFEAVFRSHVDAGRNVICITIGSKLSGTHNAARLAADAVAPDRIRIVDSGATAMHMGIVLLETADAVDAGASLAVADEIAHETSRRTRFLVLLDTLDYVYRGGRIGKAAHLFGSMLSIKPIIGFRDGEVIPVERARTWRKALARLVDLIAEQASIDRLVIGHAGNPSDAAELQRLLAHLVPPDRLLITEAGPVLLTYSGPGAVAVAALRRDDRNGRSSTLTTAGGMTGRGSAR